MVNHVAILRKRAAAYDRGVVELRRARDEAILDAHEQGGMQYLAIGEICGMSHENVRRIVREQRLSRARDR